MNKISLCGNRKVFSCLNALYKFNNIERYQHSITVPQAKSFQLLRVLNGNLVLALHKNSSFSSGYSSRRFLTQRNSSSEPNLNTVKSSYSKWRLLGLSFGVGALLGLGYVYKNVAHKPTPLANVDSDNQLLFSTPPPVELVAKKVVGHRKDINLELTLFQYEPCPFCKKVRAYLDFAGFSYDVVEVNPVTKKQLSWSAYKKVPIVIVKVKEGYQQLNDSSMIISSLASYMVDPLQDLQKLVKYYPQVKFEDNGKESSEIMNRYFLMFGDKEPVDRTKESIVEERRWRKWSDDVLMHTLSPNIYRTWDEALAAFNMFSKNGDWERIFSSWERQVVIHVGAAVMYLIGKRLKKRHNILEDSRQSLYNEVNYFLKAIDSKGTQFMGGKEPNLADLAIYGCINSIDGTLSFDDLMRNTRLFPWYDAMTKILEARRGKAD